MVNDWTAAKECLHDFKEMVINEFHQNFKICLSASHKLFRNTSGFINESLYSGSSQSNTFFCHFSIIKHYYVKFSSVLKINKEALPLFTVHH